jgi:hypothetical protein
MRKNREAEKSRLGLEGSHFSPFATNAEAGFLGEV